MHLSPTMRQLEIFKSIVDRGSFSAAAKTLEISQPSVSLQVRALEAHVGQRLFERRKGTVPVLTKVGGLIYDYAAKMLDQSSQASAEIRSFKSARDLFLSFTAQRYIANHLLSKPLADFARRNPGIEIIANVGTLDRVEEDVHHGDVDLGLFLGQTVDLPSEVIGHQELKFVAAPRHPLAPRRNIAARDLEQFPFIGPIWDSQYGRIVAGVLKNLGMSNYVTLMQSQQTPMRKEMVRAGAGVSVALAYGLRDEIARGDLVALDVAGGPIMLEVRIGYLPDRRLTAASLRFVNYLRELKTIGAFTSP